MARRTKAALKAQREQVGMTQQDVADALGVQVRSVKRWESAASVNKAPAEAWDLLSQALDAQRKAVREAVADAGKRSTTADNGAIALTYFRDQMEHSRHGGNPTLPYGVANATSRAVAEALAAEGVETEWEYPDEG